MSSDITPKNAKILCTKSGNRCALPDCRNELVIDARNGDLASLVAQMAHIKGEKPGKNNKQASARYDANMTDAERNSYDNLILLCPSCHKKIDDQPNTYTVEILQRIKADHEAWIIKATRSAIVNITFTELDIVTKHLIANSDKQSNSLTIIPPKEKINKNGLSSTIESLIVMGMTQVKQVAAFIKKMEPLTPGFTSALIKGFVNEYNCLREKDGLIGDALFDALHEFSCSSSGDFKQRAAGLSVLVYLFEKCEVFEK